MSLLFESIFGLGRKGAKLTLADEGQTWRRFDNLEVPLSKMKYLLLAKITQARITYQYIINSASWSQPTCYSVWSRKGEQQGHFTRFSTKRMSRTLEVTKHTPNRREKDRNNTDKRSKEGWATMIQTRSQPNYLDNKNDQFVGEKSTGSDSDHTDTWFRISIQKKKRRGE